MVAVPGARVAGLHFIVEGKIESEGISLGQREVWGALEVLAGRIPTVPAVAIEATETLQLSSVDLADVLEDNFGVLLSVLRDLSARAVAARIESSSRLRDFTGAASLGLVERLILFRHQLPFARAGLQALAMLADTSEELVFPAGAVLARAGDRANRAMVIIDGTLAVHGPDHEDRMCGPGDAIGLLETFAGGRHGVTVESRTPVRVLSSPVASLIDVLEDHTDVGLTVLSVLAGALLDARAAVPSIALQGRLN